MCTLYLYGFVGVAVPKTGFMKRVAAFDFGVALDNALRCITGKGRAQFHAKLEDPPRGGLHAYLAAHT